MSQTVESGSNTEPQQSDGIVDFGCVVLLCAKGKDAKVLPVHCVAVPTYEEYIWPMTVVLFLAVRVCGANHDLPQTSSAVFES